MADRYWVGGSDTWNATAGSKRATSSGGAGGAAVPTSADDVYFDANSGAVDVTLANFATVNCNNLDFTGFTGTFSSGDSYFTTVDVYGDLTFSPNMRCWGQGLNFEFNGTAQKLTSASGSGGGSTGIKFWGNGTSYVDLQDDLVCYSIGNVGLKTNDYDITAFQVNLFVVTSGDIWLGNSTITTYDLFNAPKDVHSGTWDAGTSTIKCSGQLGFTSTKPFYDIEFHGGYNRFSIAPDSPTAICTMNSCTFAADYRQMLAMGSGSTPNTLSTNSFIAVGDVNKEKYIFTINGELSTAQTTISVPGGGTVTCDYCLIESIIATGGATFNAGSHSVDRGNNTGWIF